LKVHAAFDAVDHLALGEQQFGQIGSILASNPGDEGRFSGTGQSNLKRLPRKPATAQTA
jgi:hypothetical protein